MRLRSWIWTVMIAPLLVPLSASSEYQTADHIYRCPPCGCSLDQRTFDHSGTCPSCDMELVRIENGLDATIVDFTGPIFRDGALDVFYPKLVYPVFAIAILVAVFLLLNSMRDKRRINPFFGLLILVLSMYGFKNQIYGVQNGITGNPYFLFLPISFITAIGPLIYFYILSNTQSDFRWKIGYFIHFLPTVFFWTLYLVPAISSEALRSSLLLTRFDTVFSHPEQITAICLGLIYAGVSVRHHNRWSLDVNGDHATLKRWNRLFLSFVFVFFSIWAVCIIINWIYFKMGITTLTYNPLWIAMCIMIIWWAFEIIRDPSLIASRKKQSLKSHLNGSLEGLKNELQGIMSSEKLFQDPDLSLHKLATHLCMSSKNLSQVINHGFKMNFYDFVNTYRVEEVKVQLLNEENQNLTIEAIANDAGFKSKSTFNAAFKKNMGMTPREYLRAQGNCSDS